MSKYIMCNECKMCDGDRCNYFDDDRDRESTMACILFEPKEPTIFHQITASPDVLAPKFIYTVCTSDGEQRWCSALLEVGSWFSEADAIAATVARLKEVCDDSK